MGFLEHGRKLLKPLVSVQRPLVVDDLFSVCQILEEVTHFLAAFLYSLLNDSVT